MNPSSLVPLTVFRVIADRSGFPSGLLVDIVPGFPGPGWMAKSLPELAALGGEFPCLYRSALEPEVQATLARAGWEELVPGALFRADHKLVRESVPASAVWIDGDWCMAPPPKAVGAQATSRTLALQLVQLVSADADTREIETLLRRDPTLSYQLLRLVNSLGMGVVRRISSFSQALLILGRQQLRRWLNLMLFAARQGDVRSPMLLARVAVRARALEQLARARGLDKNTQEQAFMTGMFSLLGVLFGMSVAEVLAPLSISEAVQEALLGHKGELGALLQLVEDAESGDIEAVAAQIDILHIPTADFNAAALDAHRWMLGALRESRSVSNG